MRWGVIGSGYWAQETHAVGLQASPRAELCGIWGRSPDKTDEAATRFGIVAYPSLCAMFADVDAVSISLPPNVQVPIAIKAARAGKHIILEKPISLTLAHADDLVREVALAGVSTAVFFQLRYRRPIREWLELALRCGGWQAATARYVVSGTFDEGSPWADSTWRRTEGALWDLAPHLLSLVSPILGPVTQVQAVAGDADLVMMNLQHISGAISSTMVSLDLGRGVSTLDLDLFGAAGRWTMPPDDTNCITAFTDMVRELSDAVAGSVPHPLNVRFGHELTAVLAAARESIQTGEKVSVARTRGIDVPDFVQ